MRERKTMDCTMEIKRIDEQGVFAGYASLFGVVDSQRDVVMAGAFRDTLLKRDTPIKLLWQHRLDAPLGLITQIFEDARGLYVEGRLLLEVVQAREAYALLKAGAVTGLSIGYSPRRYTRDPDTGVRKLHAIDLIEVSLVTLPANVAAQVTVVKQGHAPTPDYIAFREACDRVRDALTQI
jgi:HK97 family phage prohead protease